MFVPYYKFLKNSFNVTGRTNKRDFWAAVLVLFAQLIIFLVVLASITGRYSDEIIKMYTMLVSFWLFFNLIPLFTMSVRRLHDTNNSGVVMIFFYMFAFIYIGIIAYFVFMASKSDNNNNKYPPD